MYRQDNAHNEGFRFLQTYEGVAVQITSAAALDAQQEVAKQNVERAQLDEVVVTIKREETNWTTYCKAIEAWRCQSQAQRSSFKETEKQQCNPPRK